ncbi:serine/threonine protein kinase [Larkinella terrae]|uniref:non-specific serine/threonine protein kinase n=1 Tax=Larkinella terrae TaxID=2025311 RepID=A0A7K0ER91_9BACT|nr:serine/threonine-protein kinase [Larkinella terrae]MRS64299.1 protein kinase [Larkinella terrae]
MPTVSVNTHFPGYEIIGELGRSNARVLKARHLATGNLVAIKHFALNTDAETLRRFRLESELMTDIRHPNVVSVREVQLDMPMPFIVMEWIEGGNLRALLTEKGHLEIPTVIRLGLQMAEAFQAIHPRGIIHRDIKPENILFRSLPSGELHFLLTDFGVARLREQSQTLTGQSLMTYEYASPEQFENPRGVDVATDYYSLGVVLYECLSGRVPFSMADTTGIATFMREVLQTPHPPVFLPADQFLPPSLSTVLDWTLAKNPAERLSDVNELVLLFGQANVEQLQHRRPTGLRPPVVSRTMAAPKPLPVPELPETIEPEEEPARSFTGWQIGIVVMVVFLIGLAAFYLYEGKKTGADTTVAPDSVSVVADSSQTEPMQEDTATSSSSEEPVESTIDSTQLYSSPAPNTETSPPTVPIAPPDSLKTAPDSTKTGN